MAHNADLLLQESKPLNSSINSESDDESLDFDSKFSAICRYFSSFSDFQKKFVLAKLITSVSDHTVSPAATLYTEQAVQTSALHYPLCRHCKPPQTLTQSRSDVCVDLVCAVPLYVSYRILSYLDPVSLARCSAVNQQWHLLANYSLLWKRLCSLHEWHLTVDQDVGHERERTSAVARANSGSNFNSSACCDFSWKLRFSRCYKLRRNWLLGQCHVRTFEGHTQAITCVQFDATRIVSGSHDKSIKVWNRRTNSSWSVMTLLGHYGPVRCMHLLGNKLVSGSSDSTIKLWDICTERERCWSSIACRVTMLGHSTTVRCVQMNNVTVVSGSYDETLRVWDILTGRCLRVLVEHSGSILCTMFDSNIIISGSSDTTIKVWSLCDYVCVDTLRGHTGAVTTLSFDSRRIISGSLDRTIRIWSRIDGTHLKTLDWMNNEGHTGVVRFLVADCHRIISASDDKTLKVWSIESGLRLVTLKQHTDGVTCVQFSDTLVVSGSYDRTVKLWDFSVC